MEYFVLKVEPYLYNTAVKRTVQRCIHVNESIALNELRTATVTRFWLECNLLVETEKLIITQACSYM